MDSTIPNVFQKVEPRLEAPIKQTNAKIVVIGTGGAGNNSVTRLSEIGGAAGATSCIMNTDAQQLETSKAEKKLLIGEKLTQGLGAGGYPEVGRQAALQSKDSIKQVLKGAHLVFLTAGMGGGTGTGSAPIIAELAKDEGAIVVSTVTTPFDMERARIGKAEEGLTELRQVSDTVIVIDNNKLVEFVPDLPLNEAFAVGDELIASMIKGISETITVPSLVNLDYADVRAVMNGGGVAMIGVGEGSEGNKVEEAVEGALTHPLLDVDYKGGNGAIIHVTGGPGMTLSDVTKAGNLISAQLDSRAQVIWGTRIVPEMNDKMRIMAIITGVKSPNILGMRQNGAICSYKERMKPEVMKELRIDCVT